MMFSVRALDRFKSRGLTPRAFVGYLRDCAAESIDHSRARPAQVRSLAVWTVSTAAATAAYLIPVYGGDGRHLLLALGMLAAGAAGTLLLCLASTGLFRSHRDLRWANRLTIARLVLVLPPAVLVIHDHAAAALLLFGVSMATDVLDGVIARRNGEETAFGRVMDPLADVLAAGAIYTAFVVVRLVPLWLYAILLVRYAMLFGGVALLFWAVGPMRLGATPVGKVVAVLQALVAILILALDVRYGAVEANVAIFVNTLLAMSFGAVIVSQLAIGWRHVQGGSSE